MRRRAKRASAAQTSAQTDQNRERGVPGGLGQHLVDLAGHVEAQRCCMPDE